MTLGELREQTKELPNELPIRIFVKGGIEKGDHFANLETLDIDLTHEGPKLYLQGKHG